MEPLVKNGHCLPFQGEFSGAFKEFQSGYYLGKFINITGGFGAGFIQITDCLHFLNQRYPVMGGKDIFADGGSTQPITGTFQIPIKSKDPFRFFIIFLSLNGVPSD